MAKIIVIGDLPRITINMLEKAGHRILRRAGINGRSVANLIKLSPAAIIVFEENAGQLQDFRRMLDYCPGLGQIPKFYVPVITVGDDGQGYCPHCGRGKELFSPLEFAEFLIRFLKEQAK